MKIIKSFFARNRIRESEFGSVFNRTHTNLSFLVNVILAGVFAPAIVITSLASKGALLMLANISLFAGYTTNFCYRIFSKEMSASELLISLVSVGLAITATFYFLPVTGALSLINLLSIANHIATAVNGFFLLRNIIVPPIKQLIDWGALCFGWQIGGNYFYRQPLTISKDRHVLDRLFRKHYQHDSFKSDNVREELSPFNQMLNVLMGYINKYNASFWGSITNSEQISSTEKLINQLTIEGHSTNCVTFIQKKIDFKTTKITLLREAEKNLEDINDETSDEDIKHHFRMFADFNTQRLITDRQVLVDEATTCIQEEITRQEDKIERLEACLPM